MPPEMFSTLDPSTENRSRRGGAFICGLVAQGLLIGAAVLLGVLFPQELPVVGRQYALIWLPSLRPPAAPVLKLRPLVARVVVPKLKPPTTPELTAPPVATLAVPKIRPAVTSATVHLPEPPKPVAPVAQPRPEPKVQIAVNTGLFGGAAEPVTTKRPVDQVQTGGFGTPHALPGKAEGESAGNVPKLGAFGLPDGPGHGNGTGGAHGIQGVVASAGFGSGIAGTGTGHGGDGTGGPRVSMGGFEKVAQVTQVQAKSSHTVQPVDFQPVEIFSKPSPVYTEEARHMGIQGEVALSVVFEANGAIRVIGVVKSLGHGLDQAAERAAAQIRFKPALHDGKPADFPATLRIEFRLADQST
ncbi:MAG: TonB family protein [Terriglobia bacterium]